MNPDNIPEVLRPLIPYAETYALGDDVFRWEKLEATSTQELTAFIEAVENKLDYLEEWTLAVNQTTRHTDEAAALTCLIIAFEEANVILEDRDQPTNVTNDEDQG